MVGSTTAFDFSIDCGVVAMSGFQDEVEFILEEGA